MRYLPIDSVKIDRVFVRDLGNDPRGDAIVVAVIAMARSLGLQVVAEGVETQEQLAFLAAHGCGLVQGFLFSSPVPADSCAALLEKGVLFLPRASESSGPRRPGAPS